jgi:hypothetical protein
MITTTLSPASITSTSSPTPPAGTRPAHELQRLMPVMARPRCFRVAPVPPHVRVKQSRDDIEVTGERRLVAASRQIDIALGHALDSPTPTVNISIADPDAPASAEHHRFSRSGPRVRPRSERSGTRRRTAAPLLVASRDSRAIGSETKAIVSRRARRLGSASSNSRQGSRRGATRRNRESDGPEECRIRRKGEATRASS